MSKFHAYCGGELRVDDGAGTFRCSNCGVTGTVKRTPDEIALADVRTLIDGRSPIVTDREIQLLAHGAQDERLQQMLQELVELRRAARKTINLHDLHRPHGHNPAIELGGLVNRAGCQWFQCTAHAHTQRKPKDRHDEAWHLCCAHADEGEIKGMWDAEHPVNVRARARTLEMIADDHGTDEERPAP